MSASTTADLILASTSRYRAELLRRLRVPFIQRAPDVDESRQSAEAPQDLALRLAAEKAFAIARGAPGHWVIGSDQVCVLGDAVLGKPGTHAAAVQQLQRLSGCRAVFHTAVCVIAPDGSEQLRNCPTEVQFRQPQSGGNRNLPAAGQTLRLCRQRPLRVARAGPAAVDAQRRPDGVDRPAAHRRVRHAARQRL